METKIVKTSILIIGSGAAGLRAAISAYDCGARDVLVLGKCKYGNPHTVLATGGVNAALATMDPNDSWLIHAVDTLKEGWFLSDYRQVALMCKDAPRAVNELVNWGARFHREKDGRLTQRFFGAHTYRRTCFYGDQTGKEMMRILINQVNKRKIKVLGDVFIYSLLKNNNSITGALGIDFKSGKIIIFNSKAVIIAAGGYTKVYSRSSSRGYENHGDGAALAFDVGVDLVGMEMIQFHPSGMVYPKEVVGTLVTEAVRGEGGILLNSKNERFMKRYDPKRMELGPRDFVARSIYTEIKEGRGTPHGGVWLDITHLKKSKILDRLPKMYLQFKKYNHIDISKEKMEVAPTAHYTMGGVDVNIKGETKIKGLFAAGETVGQIHGANRLGGNSLLETIVFGKIVGERAARIAKASKLHKPNTANINEIIERIERFYGKGKESPEDCRHMLEDIMWKYVGIVRDKKGLEEGLERIHKIRKSFYNIRVRKGLKNNSEMKIALETEKMFGLCEAIIKSALMRKESRGAHYRKDYTKTDDKNWKVNIISRKENNTIILRTRKVQHLSKELKDKAAHMPKITPQTLLE